MPKVETYVPGTPSWVDLAVPDVEAAVAFYGPLFGWDAAETDPEAGGYRIFQLGGIPVAGVGPIMMEGQPPAWMTYISVEDADAAMARVGDAGGTVFMPPMDVLDVGRMAVFADTTGGACAVWQPGTHLGAGVVNEPGALVWNELSTRDTKAATSFYTTVFGWEANPLDMGGMSYTEWKLNGNSIGGMMSMPDEVPAQVPSYWLAYFAVDDTDATVERAVAGGASVLVPPTDIPPGRFSVLADPTGASFAVLKMASA